MKTYIVRIYRFEKDDPRRFVGTVEEAGNEGKRAFSYFDELWDILTASTDGFLGEQKPGTEEKMQRITRLSMRSWALHRAGRKGGA